MIYAAPLAQHYMEWRPLYGAYGSSVGDPVDDATALTVWAWLLEGTHGLRGVLALSDGAVVGFAHFRPFPRTLHGNEACYLDDLYVDPKHRGRGIAAELVRCVGDVAAAQGWTEVRWVTTPQNERARRIYERIAVRSELLTYRLVLAPAVS